MIEKSGLDALANAEDRQTAIRARRLDRFLTQPFAGAEPWTGIPGQQVRIEDTVEGCRAILDGEYDSVPEDSLHFIGSID